MKRNLLICIGVSLVTTILLCGCGGKTEYLVDKNGECEKNIYYYFTDDELKLLQEDEETRAFFEEFSEGAENLGKQVVNNKEYNTYYYKDTAPIYQDNNFFFDANEFYLYDTSKITTEEGAEESFTTTSVTLPNKILCTNGNIQKDGKTVEFWQYGDKIKPAEYYAFCKGAKNAIRLDNVKTINQYISHDDDSELVVKNYLSSKTIKFLSPEKVTSLKFGKKTLKVSKNQSDVSGVNDGKYTITIKSKNFTSKHTVIKDTTKPVIKGVKNKGSYTKPVNITVSDNIELSDFDILLDGSCTFSKTFRVYQKGKHTLIATDEAGNTRKIEFTIK